MHDARMTQFRDARLNNKITGDNFPDETMKAPLDVLKEDKVDSPIHTDYIHSDGATTLILNVDEATPSILRHALNDLLDLGRAAYMSLRKSASHIVLYLSEVSWNPLASLSMKLDWHNFFDAMEPFSDDRSIHNLDISRFRKTWRHAKDLEQFYVMFRTSPPLINLLPLRRYRSDSQKPSIVRRINSMVSSITLK